MQFTIIFALIVAILAVVFALQNPNAVTLTFAAWKFDAPLALFMLIAVAIGAILISLLTIPNWIRTRQTRNRHNKEIAELEDNLSKYRSNLIDAQNSNKDLREKIIEIEEAKEALERAQLKANEEISDLHDALNKADLSTQEAEQARQEALDAREAMDKALKDLEARLAEAEAVKVQAAEVQETEEAHEEPEEELSIEEEELNDVALMDGTPEEAEELLSEEAGENETN